MKHLLTIILFLCYMSSMGQENNRMFYNTKDKMHIPHIYFVDIHKAEAYVFCVERTFTFNSAPGKKAFGRPTGIMTSIIDVDTVFEQTSGNYFNKKTIVNIFDDKGYLDFKGSKKKKIYLVKEEKIKTVNYYLNLAYYLDNYSNIIREIYDNYPLCYKSINGSILNLINIESDYIEFRKKTTDERVFFIKDSITSIQDKYIATKNFILENIKTIDYKALKDSLIKLPPNDLSEKYYTTVIGNVSKERPLFYFKLAEDFPENRDLIFSGYNEDAIPVLKSVEGHDEIKAFFFKNFAQHKNKKH